MKGYLLFIGFFFTLSASAQVKYSPDSKFENYKGLVMAGYQGWFNTPEDGANRGWTHYGKRGKFDSANVAVELWPAMDEYSKKYNTAFKKGTGQTAQVFSSADVSTTRLHFKWMKDYNIDGAFIQRFVVELKRPFGKKHFTKVLAQALDAAEEYGRAIGVMYDLSGMHEEDYKIIIDDWKMLVDSLKIAGRGTNQSYLYHNGKPLVTLWGVGFNDNRSYGLPAIEKLLNFFKNDKTYGGCAIMLGIPSYWREMKTDAINDPRFHNLISRADILSPWAVGRYKDSSSYQRLLDVQKADMRWCAEKKIDYAPVLFPGFSWHNLKPGAVMNQIPRNRGRFFWQQVAGAIQSGAQMLYLAMFDEIDEATAFFKIDKNPPGQNQFVSFEEGIPEDYYLFLAGEAKRILRSKSGKIPINPPSYKKRKN